MQDTSQPRRFPPPWTVKELAECFVVEDAQEKRLAYVYFDTNNMTITNSFHKLSWDEARRIAAGIARLPEYRKASK